jgi:hypothetical protein
VKPSSVQSFVRFPLTRLLASGGHVRVLRELLNHVGAQSASQLASDCTMTARGVRNTLDALVAQGAVTVLGPAGARLFAPALDQPLVSALGQLFEAERLHWQRLQEQLRDVLGNLLPEGQERRYRRILSFKDEVRYGTRQASRDDAGRLLADLEEFTRWGRSCSRVDRAALRDGRGIHGAGSAEIRHPPARPASSRERVEARADVDRFPLVS